MINIKISKDDGYEISNLEHKFPEYISKKELEYDTNLMHEFLKNRDGFRSIQLKAEIMLRFTYCVCCRNGCGSFIYNGDNSNYFILSGLNFINDKLSYTLSNKTCSSIIVNSVLL